MGYQLRRDLREALGPGIKGLQRAVALEIADDANDNTRESLVPLEVLARWTSAGSTDVVRNALKRLAEAGWEFRVPIGKGKDGRLLYAVPGIRMTFLVPPFTVEGVATAPPSEGEGGSPRSFRGSHGYPYGYRRGSHGSFGRSPRSFTRSPCSPLPLTPLTPSRRQRLSRG